MAIAKGNAKPRKSLLTDLDLRALKVGKWDSDPSPRGQGRLAVRRLSSGDLAWYYRYALPDGKRDAIALGAGLSLADARARAGILSRRYQDGDRDLRVVLETELREAERGRFVAEQAALAAAVRKEGTLGVLLMAYCAQLVRDGKVSAPRVEKALRLHVEAAWPALWATPAADITADDLIPVIARLVDDEKLREADKVRSYITAAFTAGIRARQSARALSALRDLRITTNPARDLVAVEGGSSNARERALSVAELRAYWKRIEALPDPDGALLRFHLLTGGQRAEQLARLTTADVDDDAGAVILRDGKGRRRKPRLHPVPLIPAAADALKAMHGKFGPHVFTVTQGLEPAGYHVLQHRVRAVVESMLEADELEKGSFTVGDLRRTIETQLSAQGVSREVRAQLQSHGLGGVQAKHYDRHHYLDEKRAALETLHRLATGASATVTPIKRASSRKASGASR